MDLPGAQRVASILAAVLLLAAVAVMFWPVSVTIAGDTSYSCGSGFDHSRHTWAVDSQALRSSPPGIGESTATPSSACPNQVYGHRDFAIALGAFAGLAGIAALVFGPPFDPSMRRRHRPARSRTPHPLP
jgi:hypothetical protein